MDEEEMNVPNSECENCGYRWMYSGKLQIATCPSCRNKTEARNLVNDDE